jgi:orotate phosphoribosyltransferase
MRTASYETAPVQEYQRTFIELAMSRQALRFGTFKLKSDESPYFFNAGFSTDGEAIAVLGKCYAAALTRSGLEFDMLFGPPTRHSARDNDGRGAR